MAKTPEQIVAHAVLIRSDAEWTIEIDCRQLGQHDALEVAAAAATIGAVNAARSTVRVHGATVVCSFDSSGLSKDKQVSEAAKYFAVVRNILTHRVRMATTP